MKTAFMTLLGLLLAVAPACCEEGKAAPAKSPEPATVERCSSTPLPPFAIYGAANQLLEAAQFAQWVLEDIVCKYPKEEEAKRALAKLNLAIEKAEGK
jgi:hypothetical protein